MVVGQYWLWEVQSFALLDVRASASSLLGRLILELLPLPVSPKSMTFEAGGWGSVSISLRISQVVQGHSMLGPFTEIEGFHANERLNYSYL